MQNDMLEVINQIQEVLVRENTHHLIQLPETVVVGAQSVGKSSLLELLIGAKFLPKGEGIVTRTPILIQTFHDQTLSKNLFLITNSDFESTEEERVTE